MSLCCDLRTRLTYLMMFARARSGLPISIHAQHAADPVRLRHDRYSYLRFNLFRRRCPSSTPQRGQKPRTPTIGLLLLIVSAKFFLYSDNVTSASYQCTMPPS